MIKTESFSIKDVQELLNKKYQYQKESPLLELVQYACHIKDQKIVCTSIHRFFKVFDGKRKIEVTDLMHDMKKNG